MDARAYITAQAVRDAVIDHYATEGVELPERRYVFPGLLPAWDCELLGVGVERVFNHTGDVALEAIQSIGAHASFTMRGALLAVWLVRCTPVQDGRAPPTPDEMEASAAQVLADHELMADAIVAATRPTATLATCDGLAFIDWQTVPPTGGMVAGILRLRVSLI